MAAEVLTLLAQQRGVKRGGRRALVVVETESGVRVAEKQRVRERGDSKFTDFGLIGDVDKEEREMDEGTEVDDLNMPGQP